MSRIFSSAEPGPQLTWTAMRPSKTCLDGAPPREYVIQWSSPFVWMGKPKHAAVSFWNSAKVFLRPAQSAKHIFVK
jgi:hypothetical protein